MKLSGSWTNYKLIFHELVSKKTEIIFEDNKVEVYTIPLDHRIYTNGFLFKEKEKERKLNICKVEDAKIDVAYYRKLKQGFDVENEEGKLIKNQDVTFSGSKPKSYAFCSDTAYFEDIIPIIKEVDVLYHESTFLEKNSKLALSTKHSTAKQAARIAKQAKVKTLILGHYSTRYDNVNDFKEEALEVFNNIELADDGKTFMI